MGLDLIQECQKCIGLVRFFEISRLVLLIADSVCCHLDQNDKGTFSFLVSGVICVYDLIP